MSKRNTVFLVFGIIMLVFGTAFMVYPLFAYAPQVYRSPGFRMVSYSFSGSFSFLPLSIFGNALFTGGLILLICSVVCKSPEQSETSSTPLLKSPEEKEKTETE